MANKSKSPKYKEQGVKSVGGSNLIPPPYMYDQRRAMARDAMYPLEYTGIMAYNPGTDYGWRRGTFNVIGNNNNRWGWNIPIPPDQPAFNIGDPNFYLGTAPPAATATPVSAAPNVPPYNPQPNPYALGAGLGNVPQAQEYAPTNTGVGGSGGYGNPDYNYWYKLAQDKEKWSAEEQAAYLAQFYGQTDENGNLIAVGNPQWGDPYQVMPYWKYDDLQAIKGGNGKTMGTRNWRTKSRWENISREDRNKGEDNTGDPTNAVPAWVGPLVNWRT